MEQNGVKGSTRRLRGDEGAVLVEMSIAGILLVFLLLGIVMFGFLMSFRQNMTQAAAEGVRAGAVATDPVLAGHNASDQAVRSFLNNGCSAAGEDAVVPRDFANRAGIPSSVVIAFPLTAATGVTHERISLPSSRTEQAPHWARPQPKRGPCRWSSLCNT